MNRKIDNFHANRYNSYVELCFLTECFHFDTFMPKKGICMDNEWMGRYRPLVAALVRHVNVISKLNEEFRIQIGDGVFIDRLSWQIIEYFVEHSDNTYNMIGISTKLGIPQSSFSKKVKQLKEYGFLDRFIAEGNKKEIFIRPTEKAIRFYKQNTIDHVSKHFLPFFEKLNRFSDEEIAVMTEAIETLTDNCKATEPQPPKMKYIKLD